jgi:hypothetical protein
MESIPRVTLDMLENVQRTLHDYKRCFAVMFLVGDHRLPKDLLQMVWKSAAGSLEELQRKLQRRLVKQEFGYEGDDERMTKDCLLLLEARQRAEHETFHAGDRGIRRRTRDVSCGHGPHEYLGGETSRIVNTSFVHKAELAEKALRTTWFCWKSLTPGQSLYVAKRLGLVEQDYMGEVVVQQDVASPRPPRRAKKRPKPVPFIDLT